MAIRIEIAKMWNNKLKLRVGDITGSTTLSNFTKEDILREIGSEIDGLPDNKEIPKENNCLNCKNSYRNSEKILSCREGHMTMVGKGRKCFERKKFVKAKKGVQK